MFFPVIGAHSAAYLSALGLIVIQVGIGIILKSSQTNGQYAFSVSGSVTISEFFKCLLSISFILRECLMKISSIRRGHSLLPSSPRSASSEELSVESTEFRDIEDEKRAEATAPSFEQYQGSSVYKLFMLKMNEVSMENRFGFAKLALLYALINNTIFVAYKLADPGTIAITRAGVIFITAVVMVATLGTKISKIQWLAIIIQLCGLMTTQYRPDTGISYPLFTYVVLMTQVFISAVAGVYNQALLKSEKASLHAQNAVLYAAGCIINIIIHVVIRFIKPAEPSFFKGYTNWSSFLVIISNVFMGIAITAVYKYANAVVKCLASAVATGILLYLSPILFGTAMSPLTIPGGLIVFISSWLYMDSPPPKDPHLDDAKDGLPEKRTLFSSSPQPLWRVAVLALASMITVLIISFMEVADFSNLNDNRAEDHSMIHSPFNSTVAYIRFNSWRLERLELLDKYKPFFHSVHYSMPNITEGGPDFVNTTHDNWENQLVMYIPMARTMQHILDQPPDSPDAKIKGIIYYHFDVWIDPMDFSDEDFSKIWIARSRSDNGEGGGPTSVCMTHRSRFLAWPGMHADKNWHYSILLALQALKKADTDFKFDDEEWCTGWSDIYYIPRHLWPDYIFLSAFFGAFDSFHEMTIPTMVHILDQSRRKKPYTSIINWIGDCYGGCCNRGGDLHSFVNHRCGHALNYLGDSKIYMAQYDRLDRVAKTLGKPSMSPAWKKVPDSERDWTTFIKGLSQSAITAYQGFSNKTPENAYQRKNMPKPIEFNSTGWEAPGVDPYTYWYRMKPPRPLNLTEIAEIDLKEQQLEALNNGPKEHKEGLVSNTTDLLLDAKSNKGL
ncbi:uncharacterized protein LY89DRAFT_325089 [Mollisia scopiformis]|uniref:UDP-galactose transporter n=1 Tax=Mollisia scopiformis TaxID=149040 RepID=A0A132B8Z8_MOLSC|nr:uncharacterized protein LY89DRAFT_325089 [Mollisia scopiformis]KUJ08723.1 hypothetical protein LY89DRAFT_325089 [Mollisia scopiformis]